MMVVVVGIVEMRVVEMVMMVMEMVVMVMEMVVMVSIVATPSLS